MRLHWPTKKSEWKRANQWINKKLENCALFGTVSSVTPPSPNSILLILSTHNSIIFFWIIEQHVRFNAAKRFVQIAKGKWRGQKIHTTRKDFSHTKNCETSSRLQFANLQKFTLLFHIYAYVRVVQYVNGKINFDN